MTSEYIKDRSSQVSDLMDMLIGYGVPLSDALIQGWHASLTMVQLDYELARLQGDASVPLVIQGARAVFKQAMEDLSFMRTLPAFDEPVEPYEPSESNPA